MWIFVEPFDVWLFRDGKPFSAGDQSRATGMFPPLPTTFQGAIRGAALTRALDAEGLSFPHFNRPEWRQGLSENNKAKLSALDRRWRSGAEGMGKLRLRGPFLASENDGEIELRFPAPRDLLIEVRKHTEGSWLRVAQARPVEPAVVRGGVEGCARTSLVTNGGREEARLESRPWPALLAVPEAQVQEGAALEQGPADLSVARFKDYLLGVLDGQAVGAEQELDREDVRVGIERDRDLGSAKHGRLYLAHFHHPGPRAGLAAELHLDGETDSPLDTAGLLALGGEARGARYREVKRSPLEPIEGLDFKESLRAKLDGTRRFRLALVSPAAFMAGWRPDFLDDDLKGDLEGVPVRLVCATVGKPVPISGWDYQSDRPKRLRWAVPAGSVYVFEVTAGNPGDWVEILLKEVHGRSVARSDGDRAVGLGLAFVGVAPGGEN